LEVALLKAMDAIVQFVVRHGYPILFGAIFARQIGLPVPAPGFLLAAGALAASGKLALVPALGAAIAACVLADWLWYEAGRTWGESVLHLIHFFSADPQAADRRSREMFAHHGPPLLVLDKFVPGLDAVVPPLAGTTGTGRFRFLAFETFGASLWSTAYTGLGYVFSHDLDRAAAYVGKAGTLLMGSLLAALVIYAVRKLALWHSSRRKFRVAEITAISPMGCGPGHQPSEICEGVDHGH
jgi:membrane protein DedA with SNARE-associated domain